MARVTNNAILKGVSGKLGETHVYKRLPNGTVVMANAAGPRKKISKKQKASNERFQRAVRYAKGRMADAADKAEYMKGVCYNKNTPYRVALTDCLNPPIVHYVKTSGYSGAIGSLIRIKATDDFRVTAVKVEMTSADGNVLEKGNAEKNSRKWHMWNYRTTVFNPQPSGTTVVAIAFDKPGNETKMEVIL
jgi:hypothetical protein